MTQVNLRPAGGFTILGFAALSLRRLDGSRIATPHSLLNERFKPLNIPATITAVANELFLVRVADAVLEDGVELGETFRIQERLPVCNSVLRIRVRLTFANNGSGRKARNYGKEECLALFMERCGLVLADALPPQLHSIPDQRRQGVTVSGIVDIEGLFKIVSFEHFYQALQEGVGARRSYGFGAIFYQELSARSEV